MNAAKVVLDRLRIAQFERIGDQRVADRHFLHARNSGEEICEVFAIQIVAGVHAKPLAQGRLSRGDKARQHTCLFRRPVGSRKRLGVELDAIGASRKSLKILTAEDGSTYHAQADNRQVGIDCIADWIVANL